MADSFPPGTLQDILQLFVPVLAGSLTTLLGVFVRSRMEMQRQKRDEIYRPLFNEVSAIIEGDFPYEVENGEYHSVWDDFDNYQKWSLSNEKQEKIESYTEKLDLLNRYAATLESVMMDMVDSSDLLVRRELNNNKPNVSVLMHGSDRSRHGGMKQVDNWVDWFAHPLIVCDGPDDLKEIMIEWSLEQDSSHHLSYREWHDDEFLVLFEFLQEADRRIDLPDDYENRQVLLNQIREQADSLANQLKKEMDGWF